MAPIFRITSVFLSCSCFIALIFKQYHIGLLNQHVSKKVITSLCKFHFKDNQHINLILLNIILSIVPPHRTWNCRRYRRRKDLYSVIPAFDSRWPDCYIKLRKWKLTSKFSLNRFIKTNICRKWNEWVIRPHISCQEAKVSAKASSSRERW